MYYYIYRVAEFSFDSALKFLSIYFDIDKEADPTMERVGSGSDIPPSHLSFPQHALLLDNFLTPPLTKLRNNHERIVYQSNRHFRCKRFVRRGWNSKETLFAICVDYSCCILIVGETFPAKRVDHSGFLKLEFQAAILQLCSFIYWSPQTVWIWHKFRLIDSGDKRVA